MFAQGMSPMDISKANKGVFGIKCVSTHRADHQRNYRVTGLTRQAAKDTTFKDDEGRVVSIVQYFRTTYNYTIRYPNLPCAKVGDPKKNTCMPLEVLNVVPGNRLSKLSDQQTADMIRMVAVRPQERVQIVEDKLRSANFARDPVLAAFGVTVGTGMAELQGRVLETPTVEYGNRGTVKPASGSWNMAQLKLLKPGTLACWGVVCLASRARRDEVEQFVGQLVGHGKTLSVVLGMERPPIVMANEGRGRPVTSQLMEQAAAEARAMSNGKPLQLLLVIKQDQSADSYGEIKRHSDTEMGVPSQCMLVKHMQRCNAQYLSNLWLKINMKIGGVNQRIQGQLDAFFAQPVIVFGADVTHPSPGDKTKPSIAALVSSLDSVFGRFQATCEPQGHRVEVISNLELSVRAHLIHFYRTVGRKPEKILFYRDGVSEGQYEQIRDNEVSAIRRACLNLEPNYAPPITFVIVGKRHHTRMFCKDPRAADRSGNIPAGTVVDRHICHPYEHDFYLCSHAGIQGTNRPAHYVVVWDESRIGADAIQSISFKMCHTYSRCTRSVSMVPPAYYAHLLAFRARFFVQDGSENGSDTDSNSTRGNSRNSAAATNLRFANVKDTLKDKMFYI